MEQCVEWLNERLLEDCLGRQRAMAIYIVGGWGLSWFQHNVCRINTYHVGGLAEEVLDHN